MSVNIWAQVGATTYTLVMESLYGTANQLLGMNAGATALQYKDVTFDNTNGQLAVPVGAAATPSITFTGDLNTGLYWTGADSLGVSAGGTVRAIFSTSALTLSSNLVMSSKLIQEDQSANIGAAATTDLGGATGNYVYITNAAGDNVITSLGGASLPAGTLVETKFVVTGGSISITHNATSLNLLNGDNITNISNGTVMRWRKTNDAAAYWEQVSSTAGLIISDAQNAADLVFMWHVDADIGHHDMIAAGLFPAFFNQQWGGAPHYFELVDGATGTPYKFEAATGFINQTNTAGWGIADGAARTWESQGFKVSATQSISAIWVKVWKTGNPTNNLELRILPDDGTGKPSGSAAITNGTATAQSGKLHSSDSYGQWVRFVFATPCALTAGTQYHITLKSSGAVDASNYWQWATTISGSGNTYPHGQVCNGDAVPTWTAQPTYDSCFLVEAASSVASLQTTTLTNFSGELLTFEGSPLNQSNARVADLNTLEGFDLTDFTLRMVGRNYTKDKTILDICYGFDHDRIVLRCNATTGYLQLSLYESDGTLHQVTGSSDQSSGTSDIGIRIRAKNGGNDELYLYVNGVAQGTPITGASFALDTLFGLAQIGTLWIHGGFALAPTWSGSSISSFTALPSALGWTYSGGATESAAFSVSGGKLYQNYTGFGASDLGNYGKTAAGLSNANGWALLDKSRISRDPNTKDSGGGAAIRLRDGTKECYVFRKEYYTQTYNVAGPAYPQIDNKTTDNVMLTIGKGSDLFTFVNGKLIIDGVGTNTAASATNQIDFGDINTSSGENADAVYSYWKYYTSAWLPPQFTAGSLAEIAIWTGDKTNLLSTLYNSGTPLAAKTFCGVEKNYIGDGVVQRLAQTGIASSVTTNSTTMVLEPEMECFVVGSSLQASGQSTVIPGAAGRSVQGAIQVDEMAAAPQSIVYFGADGGSGYGSLDPSRLVPKTYFGLHKVMRSWLSGGAYTVSTSNAPKNRVLNVEVHV